MKDLGKLSYSRSPFSCSRHQNINWTFFHPPFTTPLTIPFITRPQTPAPRQPQQKTAPHHSIVSTNQPPYFVNTRRSHKSFTRAEGRWKWEIPPCSLPVRKPLFEGSEYAPYFIKSATFENYRLFPPQQSRRRSTEIEVLSWNYQTMRSQDCFHLSGVRSNSVVMAITQPVFDKLSPHNPETPQLQSPFLPNH